MNKILIILPSLNGGGAERLHVNLAKNWHAKGFKVDFALMRRRGELLNLLPVEVGAVDLKAARVRNVVVTLAHYLRSERPNIVIAAMWPLTSATVIAWILAGRPGRLYLSDHNQLSVSVVQELKVPAKFLSLVIFLTYRLASGIISVSKGVKEDLCRLGGIAKDRVRVIYNPAALGISPKRESIRMQQTFWGRGFKYHILSVGTLKVQKDHENLIRAFALLPTRLNAKLIILGEGPLRLDLEALVLSLGLKDKVSLPGFVVDPYPWFRSADLFVLSSRWEGFGNVLVEALECGVPVVSTDCPSGPAEILEYGRYGKLVPVQDPNALASAIALSLTGKHNREALMGRAKDFSLEKIADEYLKYFFPKGF